MRVGELGFWHRSTGGPPRPRPPLTGPLSVDVAIVGAGFTGLWTAYYLKKADPSLNVVVLESEFAGYGASGRNGGWVIGFCEGSPENYASRGGEASVFALQRGLIDTVDEVGGV
ncbi:MAG: FAD-dependent oxidoreductase, partial [Acidobacteriota bacterium]